MIKPFIATLLIVLAPAAVHAAQPQELEWDDLVPESWQPQTLFEEFSGVTDIEDEDPLAEKLMQRIREVWDSAPLVESLNGKRVRLPGYGVPLDGDASEVRTFLLVPYFGACIHTPPPPRNQIVLVTTAGKGVPVDDAFGALWVTGILKVDPAQTEFGLAGYTLLADQFEVIEY